MKFKSFVAGLVAASMFVCATGQAAAAPKYLIPVPSRTLEGGRGAEVVLPQKEILAEIPGSDALLLAVVLGGGVGAIVGVAVGGKIAEGQTTRAEQTVAPIRSGLTDFDVNALALDATKATLAANPWLANGEPGQIQGGKWQDLSDVLDANDAKQVVFFDYAYVLSADFSSLKVIVNVQIAKKDLRAGRKPESRVYPGNLVYSQTLTSIVMLPNPSKDPAENAARWGADNAALTRKGLSLAFQGVPSLADRAFNLTRKQINAMIKRDKPATTVAGVSGWGQGTTADGILVYTYTRGFALARVVE